MDLSINVRIARHSRSARGTPANVCPYCKGTKPDGCKCCKGKGVVSKFKWSMVPEEMRNARQLSAKGTK